MKIFFDTEFLEDGNTIDLISIGLVREDGAELYLESAEADLVRAAADPWIKANVLPRLTGVKTSRAEIRRQIVEFVGDNPEFWAYYASYDWVVLCRLFGRMIDLPKGWPMYCRDIKQEADRLQFTLPKQERGHHNAIADARWNRLCYQRLTSDAPILDFARRMVYAKALPDQTELHEWMDELDESEARELGVTFYNKQGYATKPTLKHDEVMEGYSLLLMRSIRWVLNQTGRRF